jgi:hypothetical protein
MLALPKSRFVAIGLLEALGVASGMSAGGSFLYTPQDGVINCGRLNCISRMIEKTWQKKKNCISCRIFSVHFDCLTGSYF